MDAAETIASEIFTADFEPCGVEVGRAEIESNLVEQLREHGETAVRAWVLRGLSKARDKDDAAAWLSVTFKAAKCPPVEDDPRRKRKSTAIHRPYVPPPEEIGSGEFEGKIADLLVEYRALGSVAYAEKYGLVGRYGRRPGQGRDPNAKQTTTTLPASQDSFLDT